MSRYMIDDAGELIDKKTAEYIDYGEEVCNRLNRQDKDIMDLKATLKVADELISNNCPCPLLQEWRKHYDKVI